MIEMVIALAIVGAVAGVIAGLFGVGGGMILVPAFYYAFTTLGYAHQDLMQICLATSLATIVVTSLRSLSAHNKLGGVDWDVLRTWAPGIMIGALVSVAIAAQLRSSTLQWIFGGLGMCIGLYMAFGKTEWRLADDMPTGVRRAIYAPLVGFFSVLMGIGGGSLGVPTMTLYGMTIHRAVATSSGFGLLIAVPSVLGFFFVSLDPMLRPPMTVGAVNLAAFGLIIAMTLVTTPLGVALAHKMEAAKLKRFFARVAYDPRLAQWAKRARQISIGVAQDPQMRANWLVCESTWFVGVDALPNAANGNLPGAEFPARLRSLCPGPYHKAQVSITYPGYPKPREGESDAAFQFRTLDRPSGALSVNPTPIFWACR